MFENPRAAGAARAEFAPPHPDRATAAPAINSAVGLRQRPALAHPPWMWENQINPPTNRIAAT